MSKQVAEQLKCALEPILGLFTVVCSLQFNTMIFKYEL